MEESTLTFVPRAAQELNSAPSAKMQQKQWVSITGDQKTLLTGPLVAMCMIGTVCTTMDMFWGGRITREDHFAQSRAMPLLIAMAMAQPPIPVRSMAANARARVVSVAWIVQIHVSAVLRMIVLDTEQQPTRMQRMAANATACRPPTDMATGLELIAPFHHHAEAMNIAMGMSLTMPIVKMDATASVRKDGPVTSAMSHRQPPLPPPPPLQRLPPLPLRPPLPPPRLPQHALHGFAMPSQTALDTEQPPTKMTETAANATALRLPMDMATGLEMIVPLHQNVKAMNIATGMSLWIRIVQMDATASVRVDGPVTSAMSHRPPPLPPPPPPRLPPRLRPPLPRRVILM
jgi:hypothetical protein